MKSGGSVVGKPDFVTSSSHGTVVHQYAPMPVMMNALTTKAPKNLRPHNRGNTHKNAESPSAMALGSASFLMRSANDDWDNKK